MNVYDRFPKQTDRVRFLRKTRHTVNEHPVDIRVEVTRGCNRKCKFCGVQEQFLGMLPDNMTFLTLKKTTELLDSLPNTIKKVSLSTIEPMWNPDIVDIIRSFRSRLPKAQISLLTNFDPIKLKFGMERVNDCFLAGLNYMHVDLYDVPSEKWFFKHRKELDFSISLVDYYSSATTAWAFKGSKHRELIYVQETKGLSTKKSATRRWHSWAGKVPFNKWPDQTEVTRLPIFASCTQPLKMCTISLAGDVSPCCQDSGGNVSYVAGNVYSEPLDVIWNNKPMQAIRMLLKAERRDCIPMCSICNYRSFRDGLWPHYQDLLSLEEAITIVNQVSHLTHIQQQNKSKLEELVNGRCYN